MADPTTLRPFYTERPIQDGKDSLVDDVVSRLAAEGGYDDSAALREAVSVYVTQDSDSWNFDFNPQNFQSVYSRFAMQSTLTSAVTLTGQSQVHDYLREIEAIHDEFASLGVNGSAAGEIGQAMAGAAIGFVAGFVAQVWGDLPLKRALMNYLPYQGRYIDQQARIQLLDDREVVSCLTQAKAKGNYQEPSFWSRETLAQLTSPAYVALTSRLFRGLAGLAAAVAAAYKVSGLLNEAGEVPDLEGSESSDQTIDFEDLSEAPSQGLRTQIQSEQRRMLQHQVVVLEIMRERFIKLEQIQELIYSNDVAGARSLQQQMESFVQAQCESNGLNYSEYRDVALDELLTAKESQLTDLSSRIDVQGRTVAWISGAVIGFGVTFSSLEAIMDTANDSIGSTRNLERAAFDADIKDKIRDRKIEILDQYAECREPAQRLKNMRELEGLKFKINTPETTPQADDINFEDLKPQSYVPRFENPASAEYIEDLKIFLESTNPESVKPVVEVWLQDFWNQIGQDTGVGSLWRPVYGLGTFFGYGISSGELPWQSDELSVIGQNVLALHALLQTQNFSLAEVLRQIEGIQYAYDTSWRLDLWEPTKNVGAAAAVGVTVTGGAALAGVGSTVTSTGAVIGTGTTPTGVTLTAYAGGGAATNAPVAGGLTLARGGRFGYSVARALMRPEVVATAGATSSTIAAASDSQVSGPDEYGQYPESEVSTEPKEVSWFDSAWNYMFGE